MLDLRIGGYQSSFSDIDLLNNPKPAAQNATTEIAFIL
jgi:hypothetical protein